MFQTRVRTVQFLWYLCNFVLWMEAVCDEIDLSKDASVQQSDGRVTPARKEFSLAAFAGGCCALRLAVTPAQSDLRLLSRFCYLLFCLREQFGMHSVVFLLHGRFCSVLRPSSTTSVQVERRHFESEAAAKSS